ncbi:MAG: hypothetical protein J7L66_03725 [Anaerolineaceae bacterium]|nr:hypothetical protein [Anaerolineaceae bacterium]
MTRGKLINFIKWAWIAAVIFGAGYYFYRNYITIADYLSSLKVIRIMGSLFFILLGKLLLSDTTRLSTKKINNQMSYKEALSITSITQLGKYLPGGIWHLAGKFGIYKARGIPVKKATQAIIWENGWLLSTAGVIGVFTLLLSSEETVCAFIPFICTHNLQMLILITVPLLWASFLLGLEKFLFKKINFPDFLLTSTEQILLWVFFGLSLWMIFPPSTAYLPHIIGTFSFSWVAGYVAIFAPGGIGVRELLLSILLGNIFSSQEVTAYATVHRLLWVLMEVVLGAAAAIIFGIPTSSKGEKVVEKEK